MIVSVTNLAANANTGAWKTTTVGCNASQTLYIFGDTAFRVRVAGAGSTDWIPVAGTASPRPLCLGSAVAVGAYEILSNSASAVDTKLIVVDGNHPGPLFG
jgi:hypothetical protein